MSSTKDRIQQIAETYAQDELSKWTGSFSRDDLHHWLSTELGSDTALDQYQPHGPLQSKAVAPANILHIVSGNTAHAAHQSLLRGLILGSHNVVKIPSAGLPDFTDSLDQFPEELRKRIEVHRELSDEHWSKADAVVAIGSDESIATIHQKLRADQTFIPHMHKVSLGVVYEDFGPAARLAARDISLYNQQGCLSLHAVYVSGDSKAFASALAEEMAAFARENPADTLNTSEAGAIRNTRENARFCSANDQQTQLWESEDSLEWTVIHEPSPKLKLSCLNRCVYVKPLPTQFDTSTLGPQSQHLSTIALHPFNRANALSLEQLPAHRICPLGQSQQPSLYWHHDGFTPLASLVKWKDIG